mmetsp:Transcript_96142/g.310431  ORF Transcript_96142/g.310431 Transcript_96142/m.310431 type:complete len:217 (+) Transcript_96142:45-695(+)
MEVIVQARCSLASTAAARRLVQHIRLTHCHDLQPHEASGPAAKSSPDGGLVLPQCKRRAPWAQGPESPRPCLQGIRPFGRSAPPQLHHLPKHLYRRTARAATACGDAQRGPCPECLPCACHGRAGGAARPSSADLRRGSGSRPAASGLLLPRTHPQSSGRSSCGASCQGCGGDRWHRLPRRPPGEPWASRDTVRHPSHVGQVLSCTCSLLHLNPQT